MMRWLSTGWRPVVFVSLVGGLVGGLIVGCGGGNQAPHEGTQTPPAATSAPASTATAAPASVGDLFPPGEGRDSVLNNCSGCHSVACSTIGQRPRARWEGLQQTHSDRVPEPELKAAFDYLKVNFDETKPEPKVPAEFLAGGCTPPG